MLSGVSVKRKIFAFFLGVIAAVFLLELALKTTGYLHVKKATSGRFSESDEYRILCLGDSFTYGSGAPEGKSYPAQLQEILDEALPGRKIRVVNRGLGGYNTSMILGCFEGYLAGDAVPQLVILLPGGNNFWNAQGYGKYAQKYNPFYAGQEFLCNLKTYKLVKLIGANLASKIKKRYDKPLIETTAGAAGSGIGPVDPDIEFYRNQARYFLENGEGEKALKSALKYLEKKPGEEAYFLAGLAFLKMQDWQKAADFCRKAVEYDPCRSRHYGELVQCYCGTGLDPGPAIQFISRFSRCSPDAKFHIQKLINLEKSSRETEKWITSDIARLINLCRERGVRLLIINYPSRSNEAINGILKKIAAEYSLPFTDNEAVFSGLLQSGNKAEDFFVADGHCNARGYGIIARNVYGKMVEAGILERER